MRTFVRLREMLSTHEDLRGKIDAMEKRYDARFQAVFDTIRQMLETPSPHEKSDRISRKIRAGRQVSWAGTALNLNYRKQVS